jgi:hypothetical protein
MGGWRAQWRGGTFGDEPLDRAFQDEETWDRQTLEDRGVKRLRDPHARSRLPCSDETMLRITLLDGLEQVTLKLEGSLVGVWVKETEAAWRSAKAATAGRPLV